MIIEKDRESRRKNKQPPPFKKTKEWRMLRYEILVKYNATCLLCRDDKSIMHVDHIKPRSKYPELALEADNLQVLCEDCNMGKYNIYEHDFRKK